jgi:hypothetical protein
MRSRNPLILVLAFAAYSAALQACWIPTIVSYRGVQAKLDPQMTPSERKALEMDVTRFLQVDIALPAQSLAGRTFQGENLDAVIGFIDERVRFVLSSTSKIEDRLYMATLKSFTAPAMTGALNVGTAYFFESLGLLQREGSFAMFKAFDGTMTPVLSPRVGIVQLGDLYRSEAFLASKDLSLMRMGILVHEARHSDCTGGLAQSDLNRLATGARPESKSCGHSHVPCGPGHEFAGLYACENQPWGAYFTGAVYNGALAETCEGCTEYERQIALIDHYDSTSRIAPATLKAMLDGSLGMPDMSHREVVSH